MIGDGEEIKAKDEESPATIFMTEDQKIMAEPWIEVFGKDPITKTPKPHVIEVSFISLS